MGILNSCKIVICMTIACSVKTLIPVELSELMIWILTCYESDERSNWWCHVARMNCYASVFVVISRNFSSNFSLAWLHNSSAILWHQPIIAYCCNFADDAHPCWSWWQPGWQPGWLATPTGRSRVISYHLRDIGGYRSTVGYNCYRGKEPWLM